MYSVPEPEMRTSSHLCVCAVRFFPRDALVLFIAFSPRCIHPALRLRLLNSQFFYIKPEADLSSLLKQSALPGCLFQALYRPQISSARLRSGLPYPPAAQHILVLACQVFAGLFELRAIWCRRAITRRVSAGSKGCAYPCGHPQSDRHRPFWPECGK